MLQGDAAPESEKEKRISLLRVRKGRAAPAARSGKLRYMRVSAALRAKYMLWTMHTVRGSPRTAGCGVQAQPWILPRGIQPLMSIIEK